LIRVFGQLLWPADLTSNPSFPLDAAPSQNPDDSVLFINPLPAAIFFVE
jgi:hypothetical protein